MRMEVKVTVLFMAVYCFGVLEAVKREGKVFYCGGVIDYIDTL